ncbi:MAG: phosphatidylglycerophosphatase A [Candidatus Omnitrophota bacterium]
MSNNLVKIISTFFYMGYFPGAPGSMASIAGVLIFMILFDSIVLYLLCLSVVMAAGIWASGKMEKLAGKKDPSCVVIDEVAGILIAFFLLPAQWPVIITAFFVFRAFDMFKIYPINRFEKLPGSWGIMMDDVVAGLYTNIVVHVALIILK